MADKQTLYFSIGQVAEYTQLPQSVLRYWETVFDRLKPAKSPGGNRLYTREDIDLILYIKHLLYEKGFTIKGANQQLNQQNELNQQNTAATAPLQEVKPGPAQTQVALEYIIAQLKKIVKVLEAE